MGGLLPSAAVGKERGVNVEAIDRERLALALDRDDAVEALRLAEELRPWFGIAKVGLELFSASGPSILTGLVDQGWRVFADLKLHDIPTTVYRAGRVLGSLGVALATMHAAGGEAMLRAGIEGLLEGAASVGAPTPLGLAVLSLSSQPPLDDDELVGRVEAAVRSGCQGVVVPRAALATVAARWPNLVRVVPGIRGPRGEHHDQAQVLTPEEAVAMGADILVVGRAITEAPQPAEAARTLLGVPPQP
jgi:orotidine-5'-phosphate decarboxylase